MARKSQCALGGRDQKKSLFWFYLVSLVQKIGDPIFGLFAHFYGQKLPQSAINEAYWVISRPGRSKLVDPGWI